MFKKRVFKSLSCTKYQLSSFGMLLPIAGAIAPLNAIGFSSFQHKVDSLETQVDTHLRNCSCLVIPSDKLYSFRIPQLETGQERDCFYRMKSSIDVIACQRKQERV